MRRRTLTAYGTQEDQDKLALLAKESGLTVSSWVVSQIRQEYKRAFGDLPPLSLLSNGE